MSEMDEVQFGPLSKEDSGAVLKRRLATLVGNKGKSIGVKLSYKSTSTRSASEALCRMVGKDER